MRVVSVHDGPHRALPLMALTLALLLATAGHRAGAATVVGDGVVLSCIQPDYLTMRCNYRLTSPARPLAALARIGDFSLPAPTFATRTVNDGSIAVLLLVDTSDPGRADAIRAIAKHLAALVDAAEPNQRFGLATFDSDLELRVPIGSTPEALKSGIDALEAKGRTTELYRNVVGAIRLLTAARGDHRALVVVSDGLAEDRAYYHRDAIDAALDAGITIHGIGYPRSVALAVGLQSLRRLAEETGGRFVAATPAFELPTGFLDTPFIGMQNIGALALDLAGAAETLPGGTHTLRIGLETSAGVMEAQVPVSLPIRSTAEPVVKVVEVEVPKVIEVEKVVQLPPPAAGPRAAAAAPPAASSGVPLGYWVVAIGLLALVLLVLLLILLFQRRSGLAVARPADAAARPGAAPRPPFGLAWVTLADDGDDPTPVNGPTFRIGRLGDNDLVLRDPSVSRHHAEIRRRRDGTFEVLDLGSMNGVLVNGRKVRESVLGDGDTLEVGDVRMAFSVGQENGVAGEDTVMMQTALPDEPFPEAADRRQGMVGSH